MQNFGGVKVLVLYSYSDLNMLRFCHAMNGLGVALKKPIRYLVVNLLFFIAGYTLFFGYIEAADINIF